MHEDGGRFTPLLRTHELTALNSWSQRLGPTYAHANACSRIDFVITRKHVADGIAKDVTYAWDAPFCRDTFIKSESSFLPGMLFGGPVQMCKLGQMKPGLKHVMHGQLRKAQVCMSMLPFGHAQISLWDLCGWNWIRFM